jgi:hypothetical protein
MQDKKIINQFSTHLFWDVSKDQLDPEKSSSYIIKKVLEYGLYKDWLLLQEYYGIERIKNAAIGFRDLEPKALNMIALLSNTAREEFRCYTTKQLTNPHWNF